MTPREQQLAARLRDARARGDLVVEGLGAAVEEIGHLHQLLARAGVALACELFTDPEVRAEALAIAREILAILRTWERHQRVAVRLADRAAEAELQLQRARAALPALRAAAEGRSRDAVRAAVEQIAAALGEGGSHGATGPNRGSVSPETMSPGR